MQSNKAPWTSETNDLPEVLEPSSPVTGLEEKYRLRMSVGLHSYSASLRAHRRLLKVAAGMIMYAVAFGIWTFVAR